MSKDTTDTNQSSEDDKAIMIGFLYGIQSDFLSADEVRHRMAGFRNTQGYKDALAHIRTEKLKLLAEVRERVIGEDTTYEGHTMNWAIEHHNHLRAEQRENLTKLEAELRGINSKIGDLKKIALNKKK